MSERTTRSIYFIKDGEGDSLEEDLKAALDSSLEQNFRRYCMVVNAQLAVMGMNPETLSSKRIYYIDPD